MEKKPIPEVGKTYKCFDDGKITPSRMYEVLITRVIPIKDVSEAIFDLWNENVIKRDWLFKETDYILESISYEQAMPKVCFFARTKRGDWFGLGEWRNSNGNIYLNGTWCSGVLDVDGELEKSIKE